VAYQLWVLQVVGSNPAAPTNYLFDLSIFFESGSDAVLTLSSYDVPPSFSARDWWRAIATSAIFLDRLRT
jgi:hypothetical protein